VLEAWIAQSPRGPRLSRALVAKSTGRGYTCYKYVGRVWPWYSTVLYVVQPIHNGAFRVACIPSQFTRLPALFHDHEGSLIFRFTDSRRMIAERAWEKRRACCVLREEKCFVTVINELRMMVRVGCACADDRCGHRIIHLSSQPIAHRALSTLKI